MNKFDWIKPRDRNRSLLIVEGHHEKNKMFGLISRCFPELNIDMQSVWIYGTNIYRLYEEISEEYGDKWFEDDIDLPLLISKNKGYQIKYKNDFSNIILIFDYEHHDPNFSEDKIMQMQEYFTDAEDKGKLYINYPMLESYQHLVELPDLSYENRRFFWLTQKGRKYKREVIDNSVVTYALNFYDKISSILSERFSITDEILCNKCVEDILEIDSPDNLLEKISSILANDIIEDEIKTASYQIQHLISSIGYIYNGDSYWKYIKKIYQQIIIHNICKANKEQNNIYLVEDEKLKQCLENIDLEKILDIQNICSRDLTTGYIWVLNTSVFVMAEYNFNLVFND